jgi:hypothetical protein
MDQAQMLGLAPPHSAVRFPIAYCILAYWGADMPQRTVVAVTQVIDWLIDMPIANGALPFMSFASPRGLGLPAFALLSPAKALGRLPSSSSSSSSSSGCKPLGPGSKRERDGDDDEEPPQRLLRAR